MPELLEIQKLSAGYGPLRVLHEKICGEIDRKYMA